VPLTPAPTWSLDDPAPETIGLVVRCRWPEPNRDDRVRWTNEGGMWAQADTRTAEFLGLFEWAEIVAAAHVAGAAALVAIAFCCPRCGSSSASADDMVNGYCGRCHAPTGRPVPRRA